MEQVSDWMMTRFRRFFWFPWMIVWGIGVHVLWGLTLIINGQASKLVILVGLNKFLDVGLSADALGILLIVVASVAMVGLVHETRLGRGWTLAFILPQYFFMIAAFLSDAEFIFIAKNPQTNAPIDRLLLAAILGPVMIAAFLHTISIIERYVIAPRDMVVRIADGK